ncbi:GNAT family N-acetyltransferase [bacterium]|nr:GNAT family N-acetyltransferase [bacterium]
MTIRAIRLEDTDDVIALSEATGLFGPSELEELRETLASFTRGALGSDHFWLGNVDRDQIVAVVYFAPEAMTRGTWNLHMIAVRPDRQRHGLGAIMLRHVEQTLRERSERLLLVETSGVPEFEGQRTFYRKNGYEEAARIRDFYALGDDKVVFLKDLADPKGC